MVVQKRVKGYLRKKPVGKGKCRVRGHLRVKRTRYKRRG